MKLNTFDQVKIDLVLEGNGRCGVGERNENCITGVEKRKDVCGHGTEDQRKIPSLNRKVNFQVRIKCRYRACKAYVQRSHYTE